VEFSLSQLEFARRNGGLVGCMVEVSLGEGRSHADAKHDPFWAAAQDLGLPVSLHLGATPRRGIVLPNMAHVVTDCVSKCSLTLAELVLFGVFERFPGLKVVSVENDAGWAAHLLERMDNVATQHKNLHKVEISRPPSDYFHEHVYLTFMRDRSAIRVRDLIGVGNLLWSSDYPHNDSTWPNSRQEIERQFAGVPEEDKRMITGGNAAQLYRLS